MQNLNANLVKKEKVQDQWLKKIIKNESVNLDAELKTLSLGMDYSCNLECPSCRTGKRVMGEDEVSSQLAKFNSIIQEIGPTLELIHIAGDGDPFASRVYRSILFDTEWERYPNLTIGIQTNGVPLTEKAWKALPFIVKSKIKYIGISIDGATAPTYEKLRLGGKFDRLVRNLEFLSRMPERKTYRISLNLNMIVQADNYQEMIPLIEMGKRIGVDKIGFTYMYNWGTFEQGEYENKAIILNNHPAHSKLLAILKDPIFDDSSIDMGNLAYLVKV